MGLKGLVAWVKNHILRQRKDYKVVWTPEARKQYEALPKEDKSEIDRALEKLRRDPYMGEPLFPEKPRKAIHQDVSKFMKHGRQAPWYRKSVKAKIKAEEDNKRK